MKIDIGEVKQTPEEIYKVGNVIKSIDGDEVFLYLVVKSEEDSFALVSLNDAELINESESLEELAMRSYSSSDELLDVKIVRV